MSPTRQSIGGPAIGPNPQSTEDITLEGAQGSDQPRPANSRTLSTTGFGVA